MSLLSFLSIPIARFVQRRIRAWSKKPIATQEKVFHSLIKVGAKTVFGKEHGFEEISSYEDFRAKVPVRAYEDFIPYIDRIKAGEKNILWKGSPIYFCKTSGTTAGVKYIPISAESISNHINCARNALLMYIANTGNASFLDGKLIFLSGSPELDLTGFTPTGRLSGIVNHHVPAYLRRNQLPSYSTNCINDWEKKVDVIVEETKHQDLRLISGIPPWVQMYFDKLKIASGKNTGDLFKNFSLFVHGGVNFLPYKRKLEESIGREIDSLETYPSSEGFIAFQDTMDQEGLLLILNEGIFYEFIPAAEFYNENPNRFSLKEVKLGINYVILLNTNAGLWGYCIGDTVKFVSIDPFRIIVTGRIKHFISAFGEHVIAEEVESAIQYVATSLGIEIVEFTIAPQVNPKSGLPYHEWFIEFSSTPKNIREVEELLNTKMMEQNIYYRDLVAGNVLKPLQVNSMKKNSFIEYMKSQGKLGGQNKVPHLSNDRIMADQLNQYIEVNLGS